MPVSMICNTIDQSSGYARPDCRRYDPGSAWRDSRVDGTLTSQMHPDYVEQSITGACISTFLVNSRAVFVWVGERASVYRGLGRDGAITGYLWQDDPLRS